MLLDYSKPSTDLLTQLFRLLALCLSLLELQPQRNSQLSLAVIL